MHELSEGAYANAPSIAAKQQADFISTLDALRDARARLTEAVQMAAASRDVIRGDSRLTGEAKPRPVRMGLIGAYEDVITEFNDTIAELHGHLNVIRSAIPG